MFKTLKIVVGAILRPLRYAQRHPLRIALLAILVWIAFTGLQRANLDTAPKTPAGIAQAVLVGEQRAFGEVGWLAVKQVDGIIAFTIDLTSHVAADFTLKFFTYLQQDYTQVKPCPATGAPLP